MFPSIAIRPFSLVTFNDGFIGETDESWACATPMAAQIERILTKYFMLATRK
jgi:hypothetical protein